MFFINGLQTIFLIVQLHQIAAWGYLCRHGPAFNSKTIIASTWELLYMQMC